MQKSSRIDLAVLFALQFEFDEFIPKLPSARTVDTDAKTERAFVLFEQQSQEGTPYRCVTSFIGSMGAQDAALLTSDVLNRYAPHTVILVGIAGSLDADVLVGDVVVADQINDYIQDGRVDNAGFQAGGRSYRPHTRLKNAIQFLSITHPEAYKAMQNDAAQDLKTITGADLAKAEGMVRTGELRQHIGHLASGPAVGASSAFAAWLRSQDRKYLALEMEAAGVMDSVYLGAGDERVLVIRGISDMSDERKATLDRAGKGVFRGLATRNALRLLMTLLQLGKFERAMVDTDRAPVDVHVPRSASDWMADLTGPDPVPGARAVNRVASDPDTYLPLLLDVLRTRDMGLQLEHRLPIVFGKMGEPAAEALLEVLGSGNWWPMNRASRCLSKLPQAAHRAGQLIQPDVGSIDVSRLAIEALGWMGATDYRSEILDATLQHDEYAFEKLGFYAFRAFALMLAQCIDTYQIENVMERIVKLVRSSVGDEKFAAGYDINREWRSRTERMTPQAESALMRWLGHDDPQLADFALIAFSQSRNPKLLTPMLHILRGADASARLAVYEYLAAQDSQQAAVAIVQELPESKDSVRWVYLGALSCMMHRLGGDVLEPIGKALLGEHTQLQALYTKGPHSGAADLAEGFLDADGDSDRGAAAIVLAINRGANAAETIERRSRFATTPVEAALLFSASVRCGVKGADVRLHRQLSELRHPIQDLPYLWRRELVYAVSRRGEDGQERGQAWGELFNVDLDDAVSEVNRFAPIT